MSIVSVENVMLHVAGSRAISRKSLGTIFSCDLHVKEQLKERAKRNLQTYKLHFCGMAGKHVPYLFGGSSFFIPFFVSSCFPFFRPFLLFFLSSFVPSSFMDYLFQCASCSYLVSMSFLWISRCVSTTVLETSEIVAYM